VRTGGDGYRFLDTNKHWPRFDFSRYCSKETVPGSPSADLTVPERFALRQALFVTASLEDLPESKPRLLRRQQQG